MELEAAWGAAAGSDPAAREQAWAAFYACFEKFGEAVWNEAVAECNRNPGGDPPYRPTLVKGENPYKGIPLPAPYPTPEERGVYGVQVMDDLLLEESEKNYKAVAEESAMPEPAPVNEDPLIFPNAPTFGEPPAPRGGGGNDCPPPAPLPPRPDQTYFMVLRTDVNFKQGAQIYCVVSPEARLRAPGHLTPADVVAYCPSKDAAKLVARALTALRTARG